MSRKQYTRADFDPFIASSVDAYKPGHAQPLPNATAHDPAAFLALLASGGHSMTVEWGYSRRAGDDQPVWTMFFLTPPPAMFGHFGGGGFAVRYEYGAGYAGAGVVYRFDICKHEKEDAPGADHRRGWHPGHCRLCGMDMTVDSGD